MSRSRQERLEEEWFIVRHSGELPEIAFHSALHCLAQDPEGPRLQLHAEEIQSLREAAIARYQEILLRDLCLDKRTLTIYRGIKRAVFNWQRLVDFCRRQDQSCDHLRAVVARNLLTLLQESIQHTGRDDLAPVFNCTLDELTRFADELGIRREQIPDVIRHLCSA